MRRRNPACKPRDVWWSAVNAQILDALKRSDWPTAQAGYFAHAQDLAEHDQPWADVARTGFAMMLRRYLGEADRVEILTCDCRVCLPDHGRLLPICGGDTGADAPACRLRERLVRLRLSPILRVIPMTDDERERAWGAVLDAIAQMPGWAVGPCTLHADVGLWCVAVIDLRPRGRYAKREAITATGATEIAALRALVALLEAPSMSGQ